MEKEVNYCIANNLDFTENLDKSDKSLYSIKTHIVLISKLFES